MKILFGIIPLLYLGGNAYLCLRMWQALAALPLWARVVLSILFWVVAFSLFFSIGLRDSSMPDWLLRTLFTVGSVWMVFLLYAVLALAVADTLKLTLPAMGHTLWYALPVSVVLLLYGYINYRHPKVERLEITLEHTIGESPIPVVAISDLHLGYGTGLKDLERYVELINRQRPDLILIVGDLIDNSLKPLEREPFDWALSDLKAPLGIWMVPGNHEYISGMEAVADYLQRTPIRLLRDDVVQLPVGVQLVGRDDRSNRLCQPLDKLLANTDAKYPTIVLDHQPYGLAEADSLGVDLLLCGHTHRGQVFPLNLLTDCLYEQSHGYRKWSHAHIWVSSGLSLWGPPFRIGTRSDLAVIEIRGKAR